MNDWQTEFDREIERARSARGQGKEGQARVCARRAAGALAREHCSRSGILIQTPSTYDLLRQLLLSADLSPDARTAIDRLLLRVDEEFKLPPGVDLIEEAVRLREMLLGENEGGKN